MPSWIRNGLAAGIGQSIGIVIGLMILSFILTGNPILLPAALGTRLFG